MPDLRALLEQALASTTFRSSGEAVQSPSEVREALTQPRARGSGTRRVLEVEPRVEAAVLDPLVEHLRDHLSEHVDGQTDRIGHSFPVRGDALTVLTATADGAQELHSSSTVTGFARGLVRAAAILGPSQTAEMLGRWRDGGPNQYKISVVLAGLHVGDSLELDAGVRMRPLPASSESLPLAMPEMSSDRVSKVLGRTLLEIDASTSPALFRPPQGGAGLPALITSTALGSVSRATFFLALSLVCNRHVGLAWGWNDYGVAGSFMAGQRSGLMGPGMPIERLSRGTIYSPDSGIMELTSFAPPEPNLDQAGLERAWELRSELHQRMEADERFRFAVTRWAKAASPGVPNHDRVIDLRIALEAVYVDSSQGELGFRLALTGARHLATGLEDRKAVHKSLTEFYRLASQVIHGAQSAGTKRTALVDTAMKLCRDGILKVVEEREQPNWTEFLLS